MNKYKRITTDEYRIMGYYCLGWEEVTYEERYSEAKQRLKEYRENEPGTAFRIKKVRVPITNQQGATP